MTMLGDWVPVPRNTKYEAHRDGLVRNARTRKVLKPRPLRSGYLRVFLGERMEAYVHTVVLETFVGPRPEGQQGAHLDGNPANNDLANLKWATPAENNEHKLAHGTATFGRRNPMGKKTHCKRGHAFTETNTRRANGRRICRECHRGHQRKRRAAAIEKTERGNV